MNLPPYAQTVLRFVTSREDEGATQDEIRENVRISDDDLDHALTLLGTLHANAISMGSRPGVMATVYRATGQPRLDAPVKPKGPVRKTALVGHKGAWVSAGVIHAGPDGQLHELPPESGDATPVRRGPVRKA